MLRELRISNFAIIDSLNITFSQGLNILTGETGAGKSIIVGALSLLLGGRASADMIRSADQEAVVEAIFDNDPDSPLGQKLEGWGISGNDCLLVKRVVSQGGKSRAYINGGGATLQMLNQLGTELIGIAGQREHQTLLQVGLLTIADCEQLLPRTLCYFDDIVGPDEACHSEFTGEMLAIEEFNLAADDRKIAKILGLRHKRITPCRWADQMYGLHLFNHPHYGQFIAPEGIVD